MRSLRRDRRGSPLSPYRAHAHTRANGPYRNIPSKPSHCFPPPVRLVAVLNLSAVFDLPEPERSSRLREARMAALLLRRSHPLVSALADAIADPAALVSALAEFDALAALPRRRLLATLAHVLPRMPVL
jgi:hypothetical protein